MFMNEKFEFSRIHTKFEKKVLQKFITNPPLKNFEAASEGNIYEYLKQNKSRGRFLSHVFNSWTWKAFKNLLTADPFTALGLLVLNVCFLLVGWDLSRRLPYLVVPTRIKIMDSYISKKDN